MRRLSPSRAVSMLLNLMYSLVILYPVYIVCSIALKTKKEMYANPIGLPTAPVFENFMNAWNSTNMGRLFVNSILVTVCSVLMVLAIGSLASFGMTRRRFRAGRWLEKYFLIGMMVPMQVSMMPLYLLMVNLKLTNSYIGLIMLNIAFGMPFSTFMLCSFFRSIPQEIEEAAIIDGSGDFTLFFRILLPLSRPALSTVIIFVAVADWNDMFFPLLMISKTAYQTVPLGLIRFSGEHITDYNTMFAGVLMATAPMVIAYLLLQKEFIAGLTAGAVKS